MYTLKMIAQSTENAYKYIYTHTIKMILQNTYNVVYTIMIILYKQTITNLE